MADCFTLCVSWPTSSAYLATCWKLICVSLFVFILAAAVGGCCLDDVAPAHSDVAHLCVWKCVWINQQNGIADAVTLMEASWLAKDCCDDVTRGNHKRILWNIL